MKNLKINKKLLIKLLTFGTGIITASSFPLTGGQDTSTEVDTKEAIESLNSVVYHKEGHRVLLESIGLDWEPQIITEIKEIDHASFQDSNGLEVDPIYKEIANYVHQVMIGNVESFQEEVFSFYGIHPSEITFRFDPNDEKIIKKRIQR